VKRVVRAGAPGRALVLVSARAVVGVLFAALTTMTLVSGAYAAAPGPAICGKSSAAAPAVTRLRDAMAHGRFIAYQPTSLQVTNGVSTQADPDSMRADLQVLRLRFDSLITYDSIHGAEAIPGIAASLGYRAVIIGIWNPFNPAELSAALAAAKNNPQVVVGLSLGNEMLFFHRHGSAELVRLLDTIRAQAPQLALSTTEPFQMFEAPEAAPILQRLDFLLPNIHPVFQPWFRGAPESNAVQFVVNVVSDLAGYYCGPILVKETGIPTAPEEQGFTEKKQAAFYEELRHRFAESAVAPAAARGSGSGPAAGDRAFAYFAAFDAPWRLLDGGPAAGQRPAEEEAHWGLYDEKRRPKPVVASIPPLTSPSSPPHHEPRHY
jgi:exo-beta-1,3-glucanase (GH17 family)